MAGGYGAVEHALHVSAPRFEQPRARHGGAVMMALTAAVLVAFGANAGGSRGAASRTLFDAGDRLEQHVLGKQRGAEQAGGARARAPGDTSTSCDCDALCAADDSASPQASAAKALARARAATSPAPAPTVAPIEYWTLYFSDGLATESYVWAMESSLEGVVASVLVFVEFRQVFRR